MALLKDIEQYKKHVAVNNSMEYEDVRPDIELVENEQVVKILGRAFYDRLDAIPYADLTPDYRKLVDMLNYCTAHLAQAEYLDLNQVQISSGGVHITSDAHRKTAFQWQIDQLKASLCRKGYNGMERALEFLESKIDDEAFEDWANSSAVTVFKQYLINSATEFQRYYDICTSRRTFLALLPILEKTERNELLPYLGEDFFDELKEQIKDRDVQADNKVLLERYICPAAAHLVISQTKDLAPEVLAEARQNGISFLVRLKKYLNQNASAEKYATYFNSSLYVQASNDAPVVYTNPTDTKTFAFI